MWKPKKDQRFSKKLLEFKIKNEIISKLRPSKIFQMLAL